MKRIKFTLFILVTLAVSCIKVSSAISVTDVVLDPKTLTMTVDSNVDFPQIVIEKGATKRGTQR